MIILKLLLLLSAGGALITRFISYKYEKQLTPESASQLFVISLVCAAVCIITALIWVIKLKLEQKREKEKEEKNTDA